MKKLAGVEAEKIKTHRGRDGVGFNAVLMIDGRAVASILDEGCGGGAWLRDVTDRAAIAKFEAEVKALPPESLDLGDGTSRLVPVSLDFFLGTLVEDALEDARIRRLAKTQVVLRRPGTPAGTFLTVKGLALDAKGRAWLAAKYPDGGEILNDTLGIQPVVKQKKAKARS